MTTLQQDVLLRSARNLGFHQFSAQDVLQAKRLLSTFGGVALGLSVYVESGRLASIVFASTTDVVRVHLDKTIQHPTLQSLFDETYAIAAFSMARIALLIYRRTGCHVRGADLSSLFARSTMQPLRPSQVAQKELDLSDSEVAAVETVWSADSKQNICLRAFTAAWSESFSFLPFLTLAHHLVPVWQTDAARRSTMQPRSTLVI
jgi:hypothetical protein